MIIDLDSHLRENQYMDEVYNLEGTPYAKYTPVPIDGGRPDQRRFRHSLGTRSARSGAAYNHNYMYDPRENWRGGEIAARQAGGYDLERRLEDFEVEGFDHQMLFPTGIIVPTQNLGGLGAALSHSYNDWAARFVRGYEDKFWPVGMVPAGCPDAMADELRHAVNDLGFKAVALACYVAPRNLDDPAYFRFYEAAEELGTPLFCHPNGGGGEIIDRFDTFFQMHILGRPMHCTPALIALVAGGVFERFPGLKVAFFECSAEWPIYWMHRMDDDYEWVRDRSAAHLKMLPSDYIKRNVWVTCEPDEARLPWAVEEIGADRICLASDYPHFDSEFPHTVSAIKDRADITEEQKELILGGNAARLLSLPAR